MGFLEAGTPLSWHDSLKYLEYVRKHGIQQFINTYNRIKHRHNDVLKWGDEIEYHLVQFDETNHTARIALIAPEVLTKLENEDREKSFPISSAWRPEYGSWMIEATPGAPYGNETVDLRAVERNMAMRRYRISKVLPSEIFPFSIVNFPLLGTIDYTNPFRLPGGPFSQSAYVSDACISPHPRFGTLTANIRKRRGQKVVIHVPLFHDKLTTVDAPNHGGVTKITNPIFCKTGGPCMGMPQTEATVRADTAEIELSSPCSTPTVSSSSSSSSSSSTNVSSTNESVSSSPLPDTSIGPKYVPKDGLIHMDAMTFGMGCCCLQVTFQARDLRESLYLYDQFAVMAPIMMALTANAPVWRGYLANTDTRWDVIAASVDCRTPTERGIPQNSTTVEPEPDWMQLPDAQYSAGHGRRRIPKSRYSSIDCYLSNSPRCDEIYNDLTVEYDQEAYTTLCNAGIDSRLARHVAHLFIRDPLVIFDERIYLDDTMKVEHFENIQSTNWRSVRWKPPPPDAPDIGWRVELRTMEAQITDFENAAFTVFIALLSRVMLFFDLNLYIPLSKVDANFDRAKELEAASKGKFFFRTRVTDRVCKDPVTPNSLASTSPGSLSLDGNSTTNTGNSTSGNTNTAVPNCYCGVIPDILSPASTVSNSQSTSSSSPSTNPFTSSPSTTNNGTTATEEYEEMTMIQILLGKGPEFPGLIPLIHLYLDFIKCDEETRNMIDAYNTFIIGRATGECCTGATYQRNFIRKHGDYKHDSVVGPSIIYDLLRHLKAVANGETSAVDLIGPRGPEKVFVFTEEILKAVQQQSVPSSSSLSSSSLSLDTVHPGQSSVGSTSSALSRSSSVLSTGSSVTLHVTPEEYKAHPLFPVPSKQSTFNSVLQDSDSEEEEENTTTVNEKNSGKDAVPKRHGIIGYPYYPKIHSTRMRGASFAEEEEIVYECTALASLVQLYREKFGLVPGRRTNLEPVYRNSPILRGMGMGMGMGASFHK